MNFGNMSAWGMGFWWIGGAIIMVFFIWFIINLNRNPDLRSRDNNETARDILEKRYAKGEIAEDEYKQILKGLSH